jgi:hypothetical protein
VRTKYLLRAFDAAHAAQPVSLQDFLFDRREKSGRQHAVDDAGQIAVDGWPQVRPRPDEIIGFGKDDPRSFGVQAETLFGCSNFLRYFSADPSGTF